MIATARDTAQFPPTVAAHEVRRTLRDQITRLERELAGQRCSHWPRPMSERTLRPPGAGPRILSVGELEATRDELVSALSAERRALADRGQVEEERRQLREEILLDPAAHPGARVSNAEVGEPGCGEVRSEPARGLLGLLMRWWRVVISSGCP